jgi:predicted DNA-binding antitoxin AbrB/MazE fold protein
MYENGIMKPTQNSLKMGGEEQGKESAIEG